MNGGKRIPPLAMFSAGTLNPLRSALMMLGACALIAATTILAKVFHGSGPRERSVVAG